ncbi:hypothetical protein E2C01_043677 [Portunus trituberculatus]|uniref:Uncharacterized protein n=1 Tax=Portunus trituberculatus TaxID=210409 RepID=A0A5B7FQW0_PORTR|nr:hypothetical protein [Portunus trituberculatus]
MKWVMHWPSVKQPLARNYTNMYIMPSTFLISWGSQLIKSSLNSTKQVEFLRVVLTSVDLTASLAPQRKESIKEQSLQLLQGNISLHDLASSIGLAVAADHAVELGTPQIQNLEIIKIRKLALNCGNYFSKGYAKARAAGAASPEVEMVSASTVGTTTTGGWYALVPGTGKAVNSALGTFHTVYRGRVGDSHLAPMPSGHTTTQDMEVCVSHTAPMPGSQTPLQDIDGGSAIQLPCQAASHLSPPVVLSVVQVRIFQCSWYLW